MVPIAEACAVDRFSVLAWVSLPDTRAGDRDLQAVQDPRRAEPQHQPGMERRPSQPVQPRRYGTADRLLLLLLSGYGRHSRLLLLA
jgi:hypothetical protein